MSLTATAVSWSLWFSRLTILAILTPLLLPIVAIRRLGVYVITVPVSLLLLPVFFSYWIIRKSASALLGFTSLAGTATIYSIALPFNMARSVFNVARRPSGEEQERRKKEAAEAELLERQRREVMEPPAGVEDNRA